MAEKKRPGFEFLLAHAACESDECVIWPFSCCTSGYGWLMAFKKYRLAHRYMCEIVYGSSPSPNFHAAHSCGNRRCVNPRHLSWKSPSANQLDRRIHGTRNKIRNKLTLLQVEQIRQLKGAETSIITAAKYGVTESNIRQIQTGRTWKH